MAHNTQSLSTRLGVVDLEAVRRIAQSQGLSLSAYTRKAVAVLSGAPDAPATRRNVASALGLKPDASDDEIVQAVQDLLAADADPASTDPLQADPATAPAAKLSAGEKAAADSIKDPTKRAAFVALRAQRAVERREQTKPQRK